MHFTIDIDMYKRYFNIMEQNGVMLNFIIMYQQHTLCCEIPDIRHPAYTSLITCKKANVISDS